MQLELIVQALRQRCPVFSDRVAGAADFKMLEEATNVAVPSAFVIPLDDSPDENASATSTRQTMVDSFAVIVAISNLADEKGQGAAATVDSLRTVLWGALLGWQPTADYDGITYQGGQLLRLTRARLWYQFELGASMEIGPEDGYQGTALIGLPPFEGATLQLDPIEPRDANAPGTGPDGRNVVTFTTPPTGDFEQ